MSKIGILVQKLQGRFLPRFILVIIMRRRLVTIEKQIALLQRNIVEVEEMRFPYLDKQAFERARNLLARLHVSLNSCKETRVLLKTVLERWED